VKRFEQRVDERRAVWGSGSIHIANTKEHERTLFKKLFELSAQFFSELAFGEIVLQQREHIVGERARVGVAAAMRICICQHIISAGEYTNAHRFECPNKPCFEAGL
jgi:hypothetical protein